MSPIMCPLLPRRVLANACYRCPYAQEKARIGGTIPLVLSYCATDPRNPMLREWGLMTIRNLCEVRMCGTSALCWPGPVP